MKKVQVYHKPGVAGSNSALVRLGRGHKRFSKSIAAILRNVILCNYDADTEALIYNELDHTACAIIRI